MKTDIQIREIENSKEFKELISKSDKYFRQKEKLQKEERRRLNKNLPLLDLPEQIKTAKNNMNIYHDNAINLLKL